MTAPPSSAIDTTSMIMEESVIVGVDTRTCDFDKYGSIRYNSSSGTNGDIEHCNGENWVSTSTPSSGESPKKVFLTNTTTNGNILSKAKTLGYTGNVPILAADYICQYDADAYGISGKYMAWLSTTSIAEDSPFIRFTHSTLPYIEYSSGQIIASDWDDLVDGRLSTKLDVTASGSTAYDGYFVVTNTTTGGMAISNSANCGGFTNTSGTAYNGVVYTPSSYGEWSHYSNYYSCNNNTRLYCFEQ